MCFFCSRCRVRSVCVFAVGSWHTVAVTWFFVFGAHEELHARPLRRHSPVSPRSSPRDALTASFLFSAGLACVCLTIVLFSRESWACATILVGPVDVIVNVVCRRHTHTRTRVQADAPVARNSLQAISVMATQHVSDKVKGTEGLSAHLAAKPDLFVGVLRTLLQVGPCGLLPPMGLFGAAGRGDRVLHVASCLMAMTCLLSVFGNSCGEEPVVGAGSSFVDYFGFDEPSWNAAPVAVDNFVVAQP